MKTERAMINVHDCVKALKKKVQRQKEKLKIAEHEKSVIRLDLEALRNHTIKSQQASCDIFEVTCTYGHPVKSYKNTDPRRNCDKCSIDIGEELYYRCNQNCNYDLCRRCAACPQGHVLGQANSRPGHYLSSRDMTCDYCRKPIVP